jgi:CheY-like chemotaxis protein/anti-sigma regulatory factor (Ser/Thr protein kinase)
VGVRVLVAEDDPAVRRILTAHLTSSGHEVVAVENGRRALDLLERGETFALILTDLNMPDLDGEELLLEVKARMPATPVIIVTAVQDSAAISAAFLNDAYRYLRKPFTRDQLLETVHAALHESRAASPGTPRPCAVARDGWVELTAPSRQEYLDRFQAFCDMLLSSRLDEKARNELRIAVQEIGQNAIEWGNKLQHGTPMKVAWKLLKDRVLIRIEDQGAGFDPNAIPDPTIDPVSTIEQREKQGKRPGGFGIHLARRVMDLVTYNERGNSVVMEKRFPSR